MSASGGKQNIAHSEEPHDYREQRDARQQVRGAERETSGPLDRIGADLGEKETEAEHQYALDEGLVDEGHDEAQAEHHEREVFRWSEVPGEQAERKRRERDNDDREDRPDE